MNKKRLLVLITLVVILLAAAVAVSADGKSDLAQVRRATAQFHRSEAAQAAGWDLIEGLDHCFENPPAGAMGFHYINAGLLDTTVDVLQPEAMVYAPGPNGQLQLGAVEYIVPKEPWDDAYPDNLPNVLGRDFHLNSALGVYVLHAWIWQHNPSGMFEDWNPRVNCPEV